MRSATAPPPGDTAAEPEYSQWPPTRVPWPVCRTGAAASARATSRLRNAAYNLKVAATRTIQLRTQIPGPRSRAIVERHHRAVADALALTFPIVAESAR